MDWKDTLEALKNSGTLPPGAEKEPEEDKSDKSSPSKDTLHVILDKKGRKGKTATIIEGFSCTEEELEKIASDLKKQLGTGGSVRDMEILIQGDRKNEISDILKKQGYKIK